MVTRAVVLVLVVDGMSILSVRQCKLTGSQSNCGGASDFAFGGASGCAGGAHCDSCGEGKLPSIM